MSAEAKDIPTGITTSGDYDITFSQRSDVPDRAYVTAHITHPRQTEEINLGKIENVANDIGSDRLMARVGVSTGFIAGLYTITDGLLKMVTAFNSQPTKDILMFAGLGEVLTACIAGVALVHHLRGSERISNALSNAWRDRLRRTPLDQ